MNHYNSEYLQGRISRTRNICYFVFSVLPGILGVILFVLLYHQPWIPASTFSCKVLPDWAETGGAFLLAVNLFYFIWQFYLYLKYRNMPSLEDSELPECAVIVPAYNEGQQIVETLESILRSDYPAEKLRIIAVDDGSTDDTWELMQQCAERHPAGIQAIRLEKNSGKRAALYRGFVSCSEEFLVTIDSDSEIEPDTLRLMVSPFSRDDRIGGVAGNIRVLNILQGFIPKMMEVNFLFCFEFIRSAQSMLGAVMCSPGALSAYRRSVIGPHLAEWRDELFLGRPSNIGDDRALTNLILKEGFRVVYQNNAVAYTNVPVTYLGLCRMLLRWGRSNIRENITMAGFMFRLPDRSHPRHFSGIGTWINLIVQSVWMLLPLFTVLLFFQGLVQTSGMLLLPALPPLMIWAAFPAMLYYLRQHNFLSVWSYYYSLFYFFTLFWIAPYCLLSFFSSDWLTRKNPAASS